MVLRCRRCNRALKNDNGSGYGSHCLKMIMKEKSEYKDLLEDYPNE